MGFEKGTEEPVEPREPRIVGMFRYAARMTLVVSLLFGNGGSTAQAQGGQVEGECASVEVSSNEVRVIHEAPGSINRMARQVSTILNNESHFEELYDGVTDVLSGLIDNRYDVSHAYTLLRDILKGSSQEWEYSQPNLVEKALIFYEIARSQIFYSGFYTVDQLRQMQYMYPVAIITTNSTRTQEVYEIAKACLPEGVRTVIILSGSSTFMTEIGSYAIAWVQDGIMFLPAGSVVGSMPHEVAHWFSVLDSMGASEHHSSVMQGLVNEWYARYISGERMPYILNRSIYSAFIGVLLENRDIVDQYMVLSQQPDSQSYYEFMISAIAQYDDEADKLFEQAKLEMVVYLDENLDQVSREFLEQLDVIELYRLSTEIKVLISRNRRDTVSQLNDVVYLNTYLQRGN